MSVVHEKEKLGEKLLCFAGNGCGDAFCYTAKDGTIVSSKIWIYYPITNELYLFADNLDMWAKEWFSGNKAT